MEPRVTTALPDTSTHGVVFEGPAVNEACCVARTVPVVPTPDNICTFPIAAVPLGYPILIARVENFL